MPNTNLPTTISAGSTGHISHANTVHGEVNDLSRSTGLRNVTSLLINGWTATSVYVERIRDRVHLYVRGLDGTAATSGAFLALGTAAGQIPLGFRPLGNSFQSPPMETASGEFKWIQVNANNFISPLVDYGGYNREFSYRSTAAFPAESTWPGTAV